jgi:hypothetical protein
LKVGGNDVANKVAPCLGCRLATRHGSGPPIDAASPQLAARAYVPVPQAHAKTGGPIL